jgi:hypothetical protein
MSGVRGTVAVVTFAVIFLSMAGTYLEDAQERRDAACFPRHEDICDDARRDANVPIGASVVVARLAAVDAFFLSGRLVPRARTSP